MHLEKLKFLARTRLTLKIWLVRAIYEKITIQVF